jgi:hypothetical protein
MYEMERYRNIGSDSGVVAYEVGADFIVVEFRDGGTYRYDYASTGRDEVEQMKRLAVLGRGLATYINTNTHVRDGFAEKLA